MSYSGEISWKYLKTVENWSFKVQQLPSYGQNFWISVISVNFCNFTQIKA